MATGIKHCKICGKEYPYCKTMRGVEGVFRWQDVACCPEHGQEYFAAVLEARGEAPKPKAVKKSKAPLEENPKVDEYKVDEDR